MRHVLVQLLNLSYRVRYFIIYQFPAPFLLRKKLGGHTAEWMNWNTRTPPLVLWVCFGTVVLEL